MQNVSGIKSLACELSPNSAGYRNPSIVAMILVLVSMLATMNIGNVCAQVSINTAPVQLHGGNYFMDIIAPGNRSLSIPMMYPSPQINWTFTPESWESMARLMDPLNPNVYNPIIHWVPAPVTPTIIWPIKMPIEGHPMGGGLDVGGINRNIIQKMERESLLINSRVITSTGLANDLTGVEQYVAKSRQTLTESLAQSPELSALKRYYEINAPTDKSIQDLAFTIDGNARKIVSYEDTSKIHNFYEKLLEDVKTKPTTTITVFSKPEKAAVTIRSLSGKHEGTTKTTISLIRGLYSYSVEKTGFKPIKIEDALDLVTFSGDLDCELIANEALDNPRPCNFIISQRSR